MRKDGMGNRIRGVGRGYVAWKATLAVLAHIRVEEELHRRFRRLDVGERGLFQIRKAAASASAAGKYCRGHGSLGGNHPRHTHRVPVLRPSLARPCKISSAIFRIVLMSLINSVDSPGRIPAGRLGVEG
jgi:hypothetical protein